MGWVQKFSGEIFLRFEYYFKNVLLLSLNQDKHYYHIIIIGASPSLKWLESLYKPEQGCTEDQQLPRQQVSFLHNTNVIQEKAQGLYNLSVVSLESY